MLSEEDSPAVEGLLAAEPSRAEREALLFDEYTGSIGNLHSLVNPIDGDRSDMIRELSKPVEELVESGEWVRLKAYDKEVGFFTPNGEACYTRAIPIQDSRCLLEFTTFSGEPLMYLLFV